MPTDDFVVTPWNVEGDIDYDKLIKRLGTQKILQIFYQKLKNSPTNHISCYEGEFFSPTGI